MNVRRFTIVLLLIAGASLSSCSDESGSDVFADMDLSAGVQKSGLDERFGKGFDAKFRADPNSEPTPVRDGDVPPLSLTTEPVQID
jgi:hypothetical protein